MKRTHLAAVCALALCGLSQPGAAKIESLTLAQMVAKAEQCVLGTIRTREVVRIDHPTDGGELYFTKLRIEGRSLYDGRALDVTLAFAGGMLEDGRGVWNSEAPSADDTRPGSKVVAFYSWSDNMGGEFASNALYAAHGGLYRVMKTRKGEIVLGRGQGYALDTNRVVSELESAVAKLR